MVGTANFCATLSVFITFTLLVSGFEIGVLAALDSTSPAITKVIATK
jgi:hypothetical protein